MLVNAFPVIELSLERVRTLCELSHVLLLVLPCEVVVVLVFAREELSAPLRFFLRSQNVLDGLAALNELVVDLDECLHSALAHLLHEFSGRKEK